MGFNYGSKRLMVYFGMTIKDKKTTGANPKCRYHSWQSNMSSGLWGFGRPWHRRTVGPSRGPCRRRRLKEAQTLSSTKVAMLQRLPLVARPSNTATRSRWCFAAWGEPSTEWGRYRDWGRSNLPVASASIHVVQVCRYKRGCCRFTQFNKQLLYYLY